MNYEEEITVEVDTDLEELINILEAGGFKLKNTYDLNDIYLVNKNDKNVNDLSILNKCVLIRHIIDENKEINLVTYKHKEYNENEEIIRQGKINITVNSIDDSKLLFEQLNFEELIKINDHVLVYATDRDELSVQNVNNKHIYIEIENKCHYANRLYHSIEEMKNVIINNLIPIKDDNYFVKKAVIELQETYSKEDKNS